MNSNSCTDQIPFLPRNDHTKVKKKKKQQQIKKPQEIHPNNQ